MISESSLSCLMLYVSSFLSIVPPIQLELSQNVHIIFISKCSCQILWVHCTFPHVCKEIDWEGTTNTGSASAMLFPLKVNDVAGDWLFSLFISGPNPIRLHRYVLLSFMSLRRLHHTELRLHSNPDQLLLTISPICWTDVTCRYGVHRNEPTLGTIQISALGRFAVVSSVIVWGLLAFADRRGFSIEAWTAAHDDGNG
jgi:hypothetical protein